ncbi:hypothetical protein FEM48_ZijujUnG0042200 [Ziziphus jujuba var. spinosa]|uniref:Uncharacterized protein n=1 Tax=Ziziphus jujuba var. spinosa TaxID=714518 RepID=A0A978U9A3_ZIZJJ|nr:hypothetical protein FEM48_ZijujUnG0042200 [Ziziphus jujuba var. spinosa]
MLVSFCVGHFFVLQDELKYAAFPVYAVMCLPVSFFVVAQFPLYFDLLWATYKKVECSHGVDAWREHEMAGEDMDNDNDGVEDKDLEERLREEEKRDLDVGGEEERDKEKKLCWIGTLKGR